MSQRPGPLVGTKQSLTLTGWVTSWPGATEAPSPHLCDSLPAPQACVHTAGGSGVQPEGPTELRALHPPWGCLSTALERSLDASFLILEVKSQQMGRALGHRVQENQPLQPPTWTGAGHLPPRAWPVRWGQR